MRQSHARPEAVAPPVVVVPEPPPAEAPGTTIVVLRLGPRGLDLVSAIEKSARCEVSTEGIGAWVLEDARTGARLEVGACDLPDLCTCALGRDHAQGCAVIRHEAVFRLKVPRRAEHERLRILGPTGREVGSFLLESGP